MKNVNRATFGNQEINMSRDTFELSSIQIPTSNFGDHVFTSQIDNVDYAARESVQN